MINVFVKWIASLVIICAPIMSLASIPTWQIIPTNSSLTFTATQNGAPVTGTFKTFSGEINFDPNQLSASKVKIIIDVASVSDAYNQLADTLKTSDWFNVKTFPQAIFQSTEFSKTKDGSYESKGTLAIRDKTLPVMLTFTLEEYSQTHARIKGSTMIKRTAFGVGQGEWADTKAVKDDVQINFTIVAVKK